MQLRDVAEADLPTLFGFQLDADASRMAAFPSRDHDAFMAHWARISNIPTAYKKTILVDGQIVGSLMSWEAEGERDVGYWIGKEFWGRGYATRALTLFLTQIEERPLYAHVAKHNLGSMRVLEKCGFRVAGPDEQVAPTIDDGIEEVILILDSPSRTAPEVG